MPSPATEIRPQAGLQEAALASTADIAILGGSAGCGKLLALDTPLPTPSGWTTMGDVADGDIVFNEHGCACRVLRAHDVDLSPVSYRMEFDDGSVIVSGAD